MNDKEIREMVDRWLKCVYSKDSSICIGALRWTDELVWEQPFEFKNEILEALSHALRTADEPTRFWAAISVSDFIEWLGEPSDESKSLVIEALIEGMKRANHSEDWVFIGALRDIGGTAIEKMLEVKKKDADPKLSSNYS